MVQRAFRTPFLVLASAAAAASLACGGGGSPSGPGTPSPTANPAPTPTPTPAPDPGANLAPGPVTYWQIKVRSVSPCKGCTALRPKLQEDDGACVVCRGDFVVFDGNQKNATGQECRWVAYPVYVTDDGGNVLERLDSSQPFLLRTNVIGTGDLRVSSTLDGVHSNELVIRARKNGCPAAEEPISAEDLAIANER